ncbi:AGE family epimerase/isomerase [Asticcacaulis taihuensis]|nr:AGE family epimerase/isomerase [Asticcacaulis taihuensis]
MNEFNLVKMSDLSVLPTTLAEAQTHARHWLFSVAAPLWSTAGVLKDGMFSERINLDGSPASEMNRRLRVQARQIYSFSAIGALGWDGPWRELTERAADILVTSGRREDGMFVHLFNPQGEVINTAQDLYDHAFGLFALAHAAQALDRPDFCDVADTIRMRMMTDWWRPQGGFWEGELTPCPPYRQNPHMHMFEAALINYQVSGKAVWRELADRLGELFVERFQDRASGAVTEYFDENWKPVAGDQGRIVEPGHCFEWAWLFEVGFADGLGLATSDRLTDFARKYGIERKHGVAINEIMLDGATRDSGARLWPQTERLKAAVARYNRLRTPEEAAEAVSAYNGLWPYLDVSVPGTWRDRMNADGTWVEEPSPASSFYHIVCGLGELLKLKP